MGRRLIQVFARAVLTIMVSLALIVAVLPTGSFTSAHASNTIVVGMGYVPSVQFAPFYMAQARGYYRQANLNVNFNYAQSPTLLQSVGTGQNDFAIADGTDVMIAAAAKIPVVYIGTLFQHLPVAVFSLKKKHIARLRDLRGTSIGIPGRFGSTYIGLLAALHDAGLPVADVTIRSIGFTQAESVVTGLVDSAVGYSNNEPILLRRHGYRINSIDVGTVTDLVGPGIVTGRALARQNPALVRRFIRATMRGLADTIAHPHAAFAVARRVHGLDTLQGRAVGDQYAVLLRSIRLWHNAATRQHGLGYSSPRQWRRSEHIMRVIGQLPHTVSVKTVITNRFTSGGPKR